jgi:hypothetical protein
LEHLGRWVKALETFFTRCIEKRPVRTDKYEARFRSRPEHQASRQLQGIERSQGVAANQQTGQIYHDIRHSLAQKTCYQVLIELVQYFGGDRAV